MKTTLGGDRLGSGHKQIISGKTYDRSTHDLHSIFRSSMSMGTLVPFMNLIALPGDSLDIDLNCEVLTLPTTGPLFGSAKVQLDVFQVPFRLFQGELQMNLNGVGMDMAKIKLPQLELSTYWKEGQKPHEQINPSSIFSYLGTRGIGAGTEEGEISREFMAMPYLSYPEIFKSYYANKQEKNAFVIHTNIPTNQMQALSCSIEIGDDPSETIYLTEKILSLSSSPTTTLTIGFSNGIQTKPALDSVYITRRNTTTDESTNIRVVDNWETVYWDENQKEIIATNYSGDIGPYGYQMTNVQTHITTSEIPVTEIELWPFELNNIDEMRRWVLSETSAGNEVKINEFPKIVDSWYQYPIISYVTPETGHIDYAKQFSQEGLIVKTYQSDLFNNWIQTEWLTGEGGIAEISAVDTTQGFFTIDALNLASKVNKMLYRIGISGGTYNDWMEATYSQKVYNGISSPKYLGSLIKELVFEEVLSNANTEIAGEKQPLGSLAGRGKLSEGKHKGGHIKCHVEEHSLIMGIVSITPRISYSQGNDWYINLKSMDDFHKPALDAIGFQDLITEQMVATTTLIEDDNLTMSSVGKVPAWINYMTAYDQNYGNFATGQSEQYMVFDRRYDIENEGQISDLTTYIDPRKFNYVFADTRLDSQNFWVHIGKGITARRKMSAKIIPNL